MECHKRDESRFGRYFCSLQHTISKRIEILVWLLLFGDRFVVVCSLSLHTLQTLPKCCLMIAGNLLLAFGLSRKIKSNCLSW